MSSGEQERAEIAQQEFIQYVNRLEQENATLRKAFMGTDTALSTYFNVNYDNSDCDRFNPEDFKGGYAAGLAAVRINKCIIMLLRGEWVVCDFPTIDFTEGDKSAYIKDMLLRTRFEPSELTWVEQREDFLYIISTPFEDLTLRIVDIEKLSMFSWEAERVPPDFFK